MYCVRQLTLINVDYWYMICFSSFYITFAFLLLCILCYASSATIRMMLDKFCFFCCLCMRACMPDHIQPTTHNVINCL